MAKLAMLVIFVLILTAGCVEKIENAGSELGMDLKLCPEIAGDVTARAYFCPEDDCDKKLIAEIEGAQNYIHAAVYSFTLDEIGDALIAARERGVKVMVVFDEQQASQQWTEFTRLKEAGVDVRLDGNSKYMHNKIAVIDGDRIVTGSYNWTQNATSGNDENLIILTSKALAAQYDEEFWEIYLKGKTE